MLLTINGHNLYVEIHGPNDAPPVILLHHGLGSTQSWDDQVPALVSAGFRVITYDRWGYGGSESRPLFSMPHFEPDLNDLAVLVEVLECTPTSLVGHSEGGTLSMYYAAHHPREVTSLVTVAAHIYVEEKMITGIEAVHQSYLNSSNFRQGLQRLHGDKIDQVFWGWYRGWTNAEISTWDMRSLLAEITSPTLVVQGEADEHATPKHAQDIAEAIPKATLWLVSAANHMLPQELPERFNTRLVNFLNRNATHPLDLRKS